jgi:translocation and assembly module TamA
MVYRKAGKALTLAAAFLVVHGTNTEAQAFKLFGWNIFGSEDEEEPQVLNPVAYEASLEAPSADEDLTTVLENSALTLDDSTKIASGDLGVVIKATDDRDRLIAALYENAYYGGIVKVTVAGQDLESLPPNPTFARGKPVPITFNVAPGPKFTLGTVTLEGDAAGVERDDLGLETGGDAGSLVIIRAGERLVNDLKNQGRPLAKLTKREAVADHKLNRVDVTFAANSGPIAPVGDVEVTGAEQVDSEFIRRYSRINGGDPYSPDKLRKASERLRTLGVFSSVSIREANGLAPDGSLPLKIEVSEGKHRYLGVGAQFSTTDGAGVQGYWGHRNLFGKAESLRLEASVNRIGETKELDQIDYAAGIIFSKPGIFNPSTTLNASLKAKTENPDNYTAKSVTGYVGFDYELTDTDKAKAGVEVEYARTEDAFGKNDYLTTSLPIAFERDMRDNKLDPTEGYTASISAKPSYEAYNGTFFSSAEGAATGYYGFGEEDRVVMAGKLAAGTLVGASDLQDIPVTRRFFAGGGGSVRGYSYQEISPYNPEGKATGGRSYVTASVEARVKITDTVGLVPFADAGFVGSKMTPDFSDMRAGAGLGLRYATPFGPLRLDVAVPLKAYEGGSKYGIYAGIGQSF